MVRIIAVLSAIATYSTPQKESRGRERLYVSSDSACSENSPSLYIMSILRLLSTIPSSTGTIVTVCGLARVWVGGAGPALTMPSEEQAVACQRAARRAVVSCGPEGIDGLTWGQTVSC